MDAKKSTKQYKTGGKGQGGVREAPENRRSARKSKKKPSAWKRTFSWFRSNIGNNDEVDPKKQGEHNDNLRFVWGAVLAILSFAIIVALVSHIFFTGAEDTKLFSNLHSDAVKATNWLGYIGYWIAHMLIDNTFGVSSILIPVLMLAASIRIMGLAKVRLHLWFLNCMIIMLWASAFLEYAAPESFAKKHIILGGMIGQNELEFLKGKVGGLGTLLIFILSALLYLFYLSDEAITWIRHKVVRTDKAPAPANDKDEEKSNDKEPNVSYPLMPDSENNQEEEDVEPFSDEPSDTATTIVFDEDPLGLLKGEVETPSDDITVVVGNEPEKADLTDGRALEPYDPKLDLENYKYPTIDLLTHYDDTSSAIDMEEQRNNKERIKTVLRNFRVEIMPNTKATIGPTITLYEITPAPGIRISTIRNLEDDIALSLSALGIRIIAPIPGKGTIGIEVPNLKPQMVSMESILNSRKFQETDYELPMALGKTITNEVYIADLTKMPHLLVAGATGQGKSVGLNVIITSLLYKKHPAELKLVMIDPKKVEFNLYAPIVNHFLAQVEGNEDVEEPIITDVNKVIQTLKSLCVEMDTRYDLLKKAHARNVKEYNQKFRDRQLNPHNGHRFMPYIVVVIDEFGDLIMTAGKEIELPIARIAQLARAVGIHMIIATQRPTTNIITGTIKANFPARMAFKVTTGVDSKTILDRTGANQLVGKGDMLLMTGSEPVRIQCAFIDTNELEDIVHYIAKQQSYASPYLLPEVPLEGDEEGSIADVEMTHLDPMFEDAARMIVNEQNGSTSMIQRKFSIGYNRAGRLMDQLEKAGIVGPAKGSKPREVLCVSEEQLMMIMDNLR
ncbi:MAG: DNA translocase FtsK 4TM domain-containing protein [Bacteroidaceae bacterium]|nr:DNA translocase FtsK 4TM domain-containing protein [Bacteroidaceae bacterium]